MFANGENMFIMRPVLRRGGRVAEGAPLLREYTSKGCRGFESPLLRHYSASRAQAGLANQPEVIWYKSTDRTHSSAG
ncbi:conserved protein of unknown function [Ectopseudomonas oleovorans]|uniref:Uncharacterized protein n=1 Tax=Ectopseudomonas oleovorans TaxID=301 RepID=A0A653B9J5_ECTOL|nr:conserved protein of unknown function [Pseudomonas oleovorans]